MSRILSSVGHDQTAGEKKIISQLDALNYSVQPGGDL